MPVWISFIFLYGIGRSTEPELLEEAPATEEDGITQLDDNIIPIPFDLDKELSQHRQNERELKEINMCCIYWTHLVALDLSTLRRWQI